jgi:hypothetical protein
MSYLSRAEREGYAALERAGENNHVLQRASDLGHYWGLSGNAAPTGCRMRTLLAGPRPHKVQTEETSGPHLLAAPRIAMHTPTGR